MSKKVIIQNFRLAAALMDLHQANPFKIRNYQNAVFALEKAELPDSEVNIANLLAAGLTEQMAAKAMAILTSGSFDELEELKAKTPEGVVEMLTIKGLGAKKVRALWQELGITSIYELAEACRSGKVAELKGFGEKTQAAIAEQIQFIQANAEKWRYADAEPWAAYLLRLVEQKVKPLQIAITGQLARCMEVVEGLQITAAVEDLPVAFDLWTTGNPHIATDWTACSPFAWRGYLLDQNTGSSIIPAEIKWTSAESFALINLKNSAAPAHWSGLGIFTLVKKQNQFASVEAVYQALGLPFVPPELREGTFEIALAKAHQLPRLVEWHDLKGILHNHSTYSDGKHTLLQMAEATRNMGYEYLGIADHSVSAYYANGLSVERLQRQHAEIEQLNQQLAPFKILKGIESDILADGSLDYPEEILATFDYVVASVHSGLKMDKTKATRRLLKAIENPYTTILGHPTGRLLLQREGYPIDYEEVIAACATYGVVIEINANPWRLDLDWRWVHRAIEAGCLLSINPDAHEIDGLQDMRYGWLIARKGGAERRHILNAFSLAEIQAWLSTRKSMRKK
ncbi:MAG: PHP domain-containing protein [Cytophagales bacterium]|nr:PHP domain-containing protein [Bernardetiaceae bacterium]MDW8204785.1 PHP domain-containing protein [Cytophagales bacterium]